MSLGWLCLHRKLQNSEVFKDPDLLRLWMLILMKASHTERSIEWDGEKVDLKPGDFITGRQSLQSEYNEGMPKKNHVSDTTLWNRLKKLEKIGSIKIITAPSRRYSIVSLLKWEEHQRDIHTNEVEGDPAPEPQKEDKEMSEFIQAGEESGKDLAPAPKKKGKREYVKGDIEYHLAGYLYYWMLENNPSAKKPNPQKWSDTIRLMIERDNRDPEEIKALIYWSQNNDFWKSNILSPDKLRKQYDTLFMQRKAEIEKKQKGYSSGGRGAGKNQLLRDMMEKEERENGSQGNDKTLFLNS